MPELSGPWVKFTRHSPAVTRMRAIPDSDDQMLICAFRFTVGRLGMEAFEDCPIATDEFHQAPSIPTTGWECDSPNSPPVTGYASGKRGRWDVPPMAPIAAERSVADPQPELPTLPIHPTPKEWPSQEPKQDLRLPRCTLFSGATGTKGNE